MGTKVIFTLSRTMGSYKLRIIINQGDIRKVSLDGKPETVEELKIKVKEKYDIGDLPATKATVKVISLGTLTLVPASTTSISDASNVSDDTEILSTYSSSSSTRQEQWPEFFEIPNFSVDVEFRLRQANLQFLRDQTYLNVPRDMKHGILEKLAEAIYKFDAYPNEERCHSVALALISKHPCLREPGSPDGCSGWKNSLTYKMGNYRTKLRKAGCAEVAINRGKKGAPEMASKSLKRPKRFEVNYLPDLPEGQNEDRLEVERNGTVIASKMDQTFPLRRREIVEAEPPVKTLKERWPALFTERQVFAEFNRIATTNLENDFFGAVDRYTPRFVTIVKSKKGSVGEKQAEIVQQMDSRVSRLQTSVRTLVLQGIPVLLGDDPSNFYNTSFDSDSDEAWAQVSVGLLTVISEDVPLSPNHLHLDPVSTAIILEGGIVMDNLQNLPQALCLLFGLSYALHLDYPKAMKNTFNFIQRVMLGLGENKLPPQTSNS
uniref:Sterile alpha motif domain containing 3 n=1 Tax=Sander lucioperca TaxID=283035 RepID=A0A8D0CTD9_SANLU